jgi:antitoxin YefM
MAIYTTYSSARENLADLWDRAENSNEVVIINRRGHDDMVLMSRSELDSLEATAHLLRSPKNAQRLLSALQASIAGQGTPFDPTELRREMGLTDDEADE